MKRNTHSSTVRINENTPSHKDAVTSTESQSSLDVEPRSAQPVALHSPTKYASFYWLINYIKMCLSRLANDAYTSFMTSWFPGRVLLPPHILNLIQVQKRLREERESHTVTYSRACSSPLSLRNIINAFKYYVLSSEDEAGTHYSHNDLGYLASDREPMFVIVDSSCVSDPSSKELLIENRYQTREPVVKRHFNVNKNVKPVDVPSTSRDLGNNLVPPLLLESVSTDEMEMVDINLQSDNDLLVSADSDCDNDSIVMSYLKNKDAYLDLEEWSEESLAAYVPSYAGLVGASSLLYSYHNLLEGTAAASAQLPTVSAEEEEHCKFKRAIEFLHTDNELVIAAELGDETMIRLLIKKGFNLHSMDHIGRNALHMAVSSGNIEVVSILLAAGVDPNVKDNLGMTPLSLCLMRSPSWSLAKLLIDNGATIVPRTTPMDTGLFLQFVMMCIPTKEEEKILHLLVQKGAKVNDPEAPGGRQALHFAAMSNNTHLIKILVELGANLFDVNHRNETPKQVAGTFRCKDAYNLLEELEKEIPS